METFLTALTSALTSIISNFVSIFTGLSDAFVDTTGTTPVITFTGGILIVCLSVMLVMMVLKWIISLIKGV